MKTEICGVLHHKSNPANNNKSFSDLLSDVFIIIFSYYLVCLSSVNFKVFFKIGNLSKGLEKFQLKCIFIRLCIRRENEII